MSKPTIVFYYDSVSPYSYFAFEILTNLKYSSYYKLNLKPILLGGVMNATGNKPPAFLPARGAYMMKDMAKLSKFLNIPLKSIPPTNFPINSLKAQRILTAISISKPSKLEEVSRNFWIAYWGNNLDIADDEIIADILKKSGLDSSIVQESASASVKDKLKNVTEECINNGAYGAPWIILKRDGKEDIAYFGSDRMHLLFAEMGVPFQYGSLSSNL